MFVLATILLTRTIANKADAETLGNILLAWWGRDTMTGSASHTLVDPLTVPIRSLVVNVAESCVVQEPVRCFGRSFKRPFIDVQTML